MLLRIPKRNIGDGRLSTQDVNFYLLSTKTDYLKKYANKNKPFPSYLANMIVIMV